MLLIRVHVLVPVLVLTHIPGKSRTAPKSRAADSPKLTVSLGLAHGGNCHQLPGIVSRLIASHFFWQMRDALVNGRNVSIKKVPLTMKLYSGWFLIKKTKVSGN